MQPNQFIIAWRNLQGIFYLVVDGEGILATEDIRQATTFDSYQEGWAVFQRWAPAMVDLNGAVLRRDEIDLQFDDEMPSPRPAFHQSDEALNALRAETGQALAEMQAQQDRIAAEAYAVQQQLAEARAQLEQAARDAALLQAMREAMPEAVSAIEQDLTPVNEKGAPDA